MSRSQPITTAWTYQPTRKAYWNSRIVPRTKKEEVPIVPEPPIDSYHIDSQGYMVFGAYTPHTPEESKRLQDLYAAHDAESLEQQESLDRANQNTAKWMAFHAENPNWNEYKPWKTGQAMRAQARADAYAERTIQKELKQEEQMKALIKHRSIVKEKNLQVVSGSVSQVAATRQKAQEHIVAEKERVRLMMEEEVKQRKARNESYVKFSPGFQGYTKPQKLPSNRIIFNAPRKKRPEELLNDEDIEMFDLLNDLQRN